MSAPSLRALLAWIERTLTAAAMAEEGDADAAREIAAHADPRKPGR